MAYRPQLERGGGQPQQLTGLFCNHDIFSVFPSSSQFVAFFKIIMTGLFCYTEIIFLHFSIIMIHLFYYHIFGIFLTITFYYKLYFCLHDHHVLLPHTIITFLNNCCRSLNMTDEASGGGASLAANWPGDDLDLLIVIATSLILILMILTTIVGGSSHCHCTHHFHWGHSLLAHCDCHLPHPDPHDPDYNSGWVLSPWWLSSPSLSPSSTLETPFSKTIVRLPFVLSHKKISPKKVNELFI